MTTEDPVVASADQEVDAWSGWIVGASAGIAASAAVAFAGAVVVGTAYVAAYLSPYGVGLDRVSVDAVRAASLSVPVLLVLIAMGGSIALLDRLVDVLDVNTHRSIRVIALALAWLTLSLVALLVLGLHPIEAIALPVVAVLVASAITDPPPVRSVLFVLTLLGVVGGAHGYLQATTERAEPSRIPRVEALLTQQLAGLAGEDTGNGFFYDNLGLVFSDEHVWVVAERAVGSPVWLVPRDQATSLRIGAQDPAVPSPSPRPSPS
jgi:hypothetical protein